MVVSAIDVHEPTGVGLYDEQSPAKLYQLHANQYRDLYARQRVRQTLTLLQKTRLTNATVLDIGPGAGLWSAYMSRRAPSASIHLLDIRSFGLLNDPEALDGATLLCAAARTMEQYGTGPPAKLWHGRAEEVGLPDRTFDLVFCKDVIEHVEEDDSFMRAIAESLKPGGMLLVATQNSRSLNNLIQGFWYKWVRRVRWCGWDATHLRFYNVRRLARMLRENGLVPVRYAGAYWLPHRLLFRGKLARLLRPGHAAGEDAPLGNDTLTGLSWLHKLLAFPECLGICHIWPFSVCSWSIGILARKA